MHMHNYNADSFRGLGAGTCMGRVRWGWSHWDTGSQRNQPSKLVNTINQTIQPSQTAGQQSQPTQVTKSASQNSQHKYVWWWGPRRGTDDWGWAKMGCMPIAEWEDTGWHGKGTLRGTNGRARAFLDMHFLDMQEGRLATDTGRVSRRIRGSATNG